MKKTAEGTKSEKDRREKLGYIQRYLPNSADVSC